ncbi:MAG: flagellar biosynthesis protein FlhA [Gammaproteobacteria bacterium]|nr:flagellar biosynthesis protein FlhA [Gammaproteobacteria bacterium]
MELSSTFSRIRLEDLRKIRGIGAPVLVLATLAMVVLPLPAWLLDLLFSFNIALAMVVLLVSVYSLRPLDFSSFPSVLLIATLLRLALNVASTRVILMHGHEGPEAAGNVIEAFAAVVIGGSYAVGLVVFLILVIINFIVVTKGAGRISEVTARFTLDAMPGKQMAIDADLNAGLITQEQASQRREEVAQEADFYGSMDGASKFVKGDAIAGILIMFINIIGGFIIGMINYELSFSQALEIYTILTIGDGLVAQIPGLLLSVASAIMVTRQSKSHEMGAQVMSQMFDKPRALIVAGSILAVMGVVPGMPHFAFLALAAGCLGGAWWKMKQLRIAEQAAVQAATRPPEPSRNEQKELGWDDVQHVDVIGLEVGYRLIPLVDKGQGGELLNRIKGVRRKLSQELGFLVPPVHIRDNLDLAPNAYRISLLGVTIGEAEIRHDNELAINPGQVFGKLEGAVTKDPAFGLEAVWISPTQRDRAQALGYTVVDAATVVATHLSQILTNNAAQLLGHDEVQNLLDRMARTQAKLVEGLVPDIMSLGTIAKVMQNLLHEGVPIRDLRTLIQTLKEYGPRSQDADVLTAACRIALRRLIIQEVSGANTELPVITLAPELEQMLHKSMQATGGEGAGLEPGLAERLQQSLTTAASEQELMGQPAILLTSGILRSTLARFVKFTIPALRVLSYQEVPDDKRIRIVRSIGR